MAKIGLKCPVAAQITGYDSATGAPTYGNGFIIGKAVTAEKTIESNSNPLYGDDAIAENDSSFASGTIKLGVTDFGNDYADGLQVQAKMLGNIVSSVTGGGYSIRRASGQFAPYLGFGFYKTKVHNGQRIYEATWLYKTQFKTPSDATNTKGQSIEWQTPEIEGTVMVVEGFDGDTYEDTAIFTTEGAAKSWLFAKANIMPNADRSQLNSKITEISELDSEDYTSASWAVLYNKLTEVQVATRKSYMSQTEVNALYAGLQTAYVALKERSAS